MRNIGPDTTAVVKNGEKRAFADFTAKLLPLGFAHTKARFWTRQREHTIEFIHLHRSGISYGAPINYQVSFRVHLGIRVINDDSPAAHLNGPCSDKMFRRPLSYHLRFNCQTWSQYDRCINDLFEVVTEQGEPWFGKFSDPIALLNEPDSPLKPDERAALTLSVSDGIAEARKLASFKILGIKGKPRGGS